MAMGLLSGKRGNWQGRKDNSWLAQTGWNSALRPSANRRLHSFLRKPQLSPAFTPRPTAYVLARYLLFPLRLAQGRHRTADQGSDLRRDRPGRSEEHTSELQSPCNLVCRLLLEKKTIIRLPIPRWLRLQLLKLKRQHFKPGISQQVIAPDRRHHVAFADQQCGIMHVCRRRRLAA